MRINKRRLRARAREYQRARRLTELRRASGWALSAAWLTEFCRARYLEPWPSLLAQLERAMDEVER